MKKLFVAISLLFLATASRAAEGQARFLLGTKSLSTKDWGALDSQPEYGVELDFKPGNWPIWLTSGYLSSRDEATVITSLSPFTAHDIEGRTQEFRVGVKKDVQVLPFLILAGSGGPALIQAEIDDESLSTIRDSGSAMGFWATGDVIFLIGKAGLGLSYRYSQADVDLLGKKRNAGGQHWMFALGFSW